MRPSPEFLADLKALCVKHGVTIYGADYHDGILIGEAEGEITIAIEESASPDDPPMIVISTKTRPA